MTGLEIWGETRETFVYIFALPFVLTSCRRNVNISQLVNDVDFEPMVF